MAVIITNMDMPKSCSDCPICHCKGKDDPWNYCCFATMDDINVEEWDKERYITCPLKSIDDIKADIVNIPEERHITDTMGYFYGAQSVPANEVKQYVFEIIDKHCGKDKL